MIKKYSKKCKLESLRQFKNNKNQELKQKRKINSWCLKKRNFLIYHKPNQKFNKLS